MDFGVDSDLPEPTRSLPFFYEQRDKKNLKRTKKPASPANMAKGETFFGGGGVTTLAYREHVTYFR